MQQVAAVLPQRQVQVGAASDLVEEGLGGEAGPVAVGERDSTHGVAQRDLGVCRRDRVRRGDRDLVLARPVLVQDALDCDPSLDQRIHDRGHHGLRVVQADRAVHRPPRQWLEPAVGRRAAQIELELEGGADGDPELLGSAHLTPQERARAGKPRHLVAVDQSHITEATPGAQASSE